MAIPLISLLQLDPEMPVEGVVPELVFWVSESPSDGTCRRPVPAAKIRRLRGHGHIRGYSVTDRGRKVGSEETYHGSTRDQSDDG